MNNKCEYCGKKIDKDNLNLKCDVCFIRARVSSLDSRIGKIEGVVGKFIKDKEREEEKTERFK